MVDDERNFLYLYFIRALIQTQPKVFVAENVKGILTLGDGIVFKQIKEDFASAGYKIYTKLLDATKFGVPQQRERVFIVGKRNDLDKIYQFPKETHGSSGQPILTLKDSIYDLKDNPGYYHKGSYSSMYLSRNRKKKWDEPSFTIQASGRHAPLHPDGSPMKFVSKDKWILPNGESEHRRLSIKEIARIQTFPDWFSFYDSDDLSSGEIDKIYKQIGNAIPVELAKHIFIPISKFAKEILSKKRKRDDE